MRSAKLLRSPTPEVWDTTLLHPAADAQTHPPHGRPASPPRLPPKARGSPARCKVGRRHPTVPSPPVPPSRLSLACGHRQHCTQTTPLLAPKLSPQGARNLCRPRTERPRPNTAYFRSSAPPSSTRAPPRKLRLPVSPPLPLSCVGPPQSALFRYPGPAGDWSFPVPLSASLRLARTFRALLCCA